MGYRVFSHLKRNLILLWNISKEEWNYLECKISILLTFIVLLVILVVIFTDYSLPILPVYSYTLTTFAALLAIVPTVSLTVIGISTSGYSIKLAKIYQRNMYFWYLLLAYVAIILLSMFGLLYSNMATPLLNTIMFILSFYGIVYLIPYFLAMMRLLDPKKAIEKLGQRISPHNVVSIIEHKTLSLVPPPEDPISPLMEISANAVEKKDMELLQLTLAEIVKRYDANLMFLQKMRPQKESTFGDVEKEVVLTNKMREIVDHFMNHLRDLSKNALREKNERAIACLIDYFRDFAQHTMKYRFIEAFRGDSLPSYRWIYEIFNLGEECLILLFWDGAATSLRALSNLSEIALYHKYCDLHCGIASLIKNLSLDGIQSPYLPRYFLPGVILHSMSDCVQNRMKYGVYDFALAMQIEDLNQLSFEVVKRATYATGLLSRCYEKLLAVAMFDYYVGKGEKLEQVAKVILRVFPFSFQYYGTFCFLVQDRSQRKVRFAPSNYSPEKAFRDLLIHGLGETAKQAVILGKELCASEICSSLLEISRIYFEFEDEKSIKETFNILKEIYLSAKDREKIQTANIPAKLFSIGFACMHKGFDSAVVEAISSLKNLAISVTKQFPKTEESTEIVFFIEYLGAAAIDIKKQNLTIEALNAIIEFEEEYARNYGSLPQKNYISLLIQRMKEIELHPWRDTECSIKEEKAWLYRLFEQKISFEKPLVNNKALDDFYTLYLFRKLPLCP